MRRHVAIFALLSAWFCANGAVWNVVQVVAWVKMFHDYSQVLPATEALALTFEGEPCELCHFAQAGANAARDHLPDGDSFGGSDRLLIAFPSASPLVFSTPDFSWPGLVNETGRTRTDGVPVPPPRA